ncbi:hypothetical protein [endosymbiont GvMRE of Glomus versiforme]|uniref:hypothetical protein n=1 Tax=endosymbiont GvMRE of Glomus versiforme TaxID=2039283 RepID=UPI000ECC0F9F|nr:hypothetical protein [endosymbiont GvMRE of Glomus versiforme]RHZ36047.1 hypothetical protein GvMRE_Ic3g132 [endosymbiont GvMRE of Glomus versiforme]
MDVKELKQFLNKFETEGLKEASWLELRRLGNLMTLQGSALMALAEAKETKEDYRNFLNSSELNEKRA